MKDMDTEKLKTFLLETVDFSNMKVNSGIYEYSYPGDNKLSFGVSLEKEGEDICYIYNLFCEDEYINISEKGTADEPLNKRILEEMLERYLFYKNILKKEEKKDEK